MACLLRTRKKRLQEIKSRSKRLRCGQTGHWSGDPQCPKGRGAQQPSGKGQHQASKGGKQDSKPSPRPGPKQAFLATAVPNSSSSDATSTVYTLTVAPLTPAPKHTWHTEGKVPGSREQPGTRPGMPCHPEEIGSSEWDNTRDSALRKCFIAFRAT